MRALKKQFWRRLLLFDRIIRDCSFQVIDQTDFYVTEDVRVIADI
jgi:hypothetical protein